MFKLFGLIAVMFVMVVPMALAVPDGSGGGRPNCTAYSPYYTWTGADGRTWVCVPTGGGSWGWR